MKRTIISLAALVCCTFGVFAQTDLVATLSHGSNLTTYFGANALSEAYETAVEGDVVTLSPGGFNAVNIEKAIIVRGAGMMATETNGYISTQITGDMTINVPSNTSTILTIEGIQALGSVHINGENLAPVKVLKSRFEAGVSGYGVSMNAYSCIFATGLSADNYYGQRNTIFKCLNCVIVSAQCSGYYDYYGTVARIEATNSLVNIYYNSASYCVFNNCIITSHLAGNNPLPETCSAQNCIGINTTNTPDLFVNINNPSNFMVEGSSEAAFTSIFKTLSMLEARPAFTETFELTETAAASYLGDDGTQVGIYGGTNAFNPTPSNPQIKKFTVNSTTEGNQLKVKINVE